jgi:hypothetical protein
MSLIEKIDTPRQATINRMARDRFKNSIGYSANGANPNSP